jgi:hypothetical protein
MRFFFGLNCWYLLVNLIIELFVMPIIGLLIFNRHKKGLDINT